MLRLDCDRKAIRGPGDRFESYASDASNRAAGIAISPFVDALADAPPSASWHARMQHQLVSKLPAYGYLNACHVRCYSRWREGGYPGEAQGVTQPQAGASSFPHPEMHEVVARAARVARIAGIRGHELACSCTALPPRGAPEVQVVAGFIGVHDAVAASKREHWIGTQQDDAGKGCKAGRGPSPHVFVIEAGRSSHKFCASDDRCRGYGAANPLSDCTRPRLSNVIARPPP